MESSYDDVKDPTWDDRSSIETSYDDNDDDNYNDLLGYMRSDSCSFPFVQQDSSQQEWPPQDTTTLTTSSIVGSTTTGLLFHRKKKRKRDSSQEVERHQAMALIEALREYLHLFKQPARLDLFLSRLRWADDEEEEGEEEGEAINQSLPYAFHGPTTGAFLFDSRGQETPPEGPLEEVLQSDFESSVTPHFDLKQRTTRLINTTKTSWPFERRGSKPWIILAKDQPPDPTACSVQHWLTSYTLKDPSSRTRKKGGRFIRCPDCPSRGHRIRIKGQHSASRIDPADDCILVTLTTFGCNKCHYVLWERFNEPNETPIIRRYYST